MGCGAVSRRPHGLSTSSKHDAGAPIGTEGLARVVQAVPVPVVGIGGITVEGAAEVRRSGAAGAAVISAITDADSVERTVEAMLAPWA